MKLIIVINGKGGVGKDTVCDIVARHHKAVNVSSITPIKEIARMHGWDGGKDDRGRKLLVDLKRAFTEYNDLPTNYLIGEAEKFLASGAEVFFAHIREASEIDKFAAAARAIAGGRAEVKTLLVRRKLQDRVFGNDSDDKVEEYRYDWIYDNDGPLDSMDADFMENFNKWQSE
jgi:hypothetical protein